MKEGWREVTDEIDATERQPCPVKDIGYIPETDPSLPKVSLPNLSYGLPTYMVLIYNI